MIALKTYASLQHVFATNTRSSKLNTNLMANVIHSRHNRESIVFMEKVDYFSAFEKISTNA